MFFNFLFYALLLLFLILFRSARRKGLFGLELFSILAFNLTCIYIFFYESALWIAGSAIFLLLVRKGSQRFSIPALIPIGAAVALIFFVAMKVHAGSMPFPIGLSYVMFLAIGFLVDQYRQPSLVKESSMGCVLGLSFSPLLAGGPFVSLRNIANQFMSGSSITNDSDKEAALLFSMGALKKTIANAIFFYCGISTLFTSGSPTWLAIFAIPAYIYADFSGYSDMARGISLAFGIRIEPNFAAPYLANSFSDFWRRWHISWGEWFRNYVFNTLVFDFGPRFGVRNKSAVILFATLAAIVTAILVGLWHSVSLKFFLWGLLIGILVCFPRIIGSSNGAGKFRTFFFRAKLFAVILFLQLMFFASNIPSLFQTLAAALGSTAFSPLNALAIIAVVGIAYAINALDVMAYKSMPTIVRSPWMPLMISGLLFISLFGQKSGVQFVYTRF